MRPRVVIPVVARPCFAVLGAAILTLSGCDRDSPLTPDRPPGYAPRFTTSTVPNLKGAFIGDQGDGSEAIAVLQLIRDEGADLVLHQGDFDYGNDPTAWDNMITSVLGADFPYFASVGNHDEVMYRGPGGYQEKLQQRLDRVTGATCSGDLGVNSACRYQGLFFILSGVGTLGSGHETYIREQLAADNSTWRICSWHKNQNALQLGTKGNEVGWGPYEACREFGAIVATAHEHSYERTKTLINTELQQVDPSWPGPTSLRAAPGATFVFVSGIGGASIRNQDRCRPTTYPYGCNGEWASVYTSDQGAQYGALFIEFHVDGDANKARGYFKNINGEIVDEFTVTSQFLTGGPTADFTSTEDPLLTITFADASTDSDGTLVSWNWDFGDGATSMSQNPTHAYDAAGVYEVTLTVTDNEGLTGARTKSVTAGPQPTVVDVRVAASGDDAEERASGSMYMTSSDLELVIDGQAQTVGMRFNAVALPPGALITSAYVQFQVDETNSTTTSLLIEGEATGHASPFSTSAGNISSRNRTGNSVSWSPAPWTTAGVAGIDQRTPDIASIIQEIVSSPGWSSGNSLVIIITGTGKRTAESFDGEAAAAPLLHVDYSTSTEPNIAPTASFSWLATDLSVVFTDGSSDPDGTVTSWDWSFDDGGNSTEQNPTHTYAAAGDYTVTLMVTDNAGATGTTTGTVSVTAPANQPPTASFSWSATDLSVLFTDGSSDPDGAVTSWDWSFGDGGSSTEQNPTHTYAAAGDYAVTLMVTDNAGATGTTTETVSVTAPANQPPTASFSWSATDLSVLFTDGSSDPDGTVTSWDWSFDDGGNSTEQNPTHTYAAAGDYTVTLMVTDNAGATGTTTETVSVTAPANQPPTASFSWSATDLSVLFTDGSSDPDGTVTSWDWSFGDGGSSTEQNPTHTYAAAGDYTVTLMVTDNDGTTDTFSEVVTVSEPPTVVTVSKILPNTMVEGSSITMTINGSGFAPGATVTFENGNGPAPNAANVVVVDENTITATVTAKNGGPPRDRLWDVRVSNSDGSSGVLTGGLTVKNN